MTNKFVSNNAGSVAQAMQEALEASLEMQWVMFENESAGHAGPATDSHFKLVVVADAFAGLSRVKRHQLIYRLLGEFLRSGVHALSLHLFTAQEWQESEGAVPNSPDCAGAAKQSERTKLL